VTEAERRKKDDRGLRENGAREKKNLVCPRANLI